VITVVGGANIDVIGTADETLRERDSNPGRVIVAPGGVGRNMAERFVALGHDVRLIAALGDDAHGRLLQDDCARLNIDLRHARFVPGGRTPAYLCINGPDGDLRLAVNDMAICAALTPEFLGAQLRAMNDSALCVLDANISAEALVFLAEHVRAPLAADPVSVAKAGRLAPALHKLSLIKPNVPEAERLTGLSAQRAGEPALAKALLGMGVARVFLSLGARGVYYLDEYGGDALPCYPGPVVDTTGCGDAFLAAAASAMLHGADTRTCAKHGLAAAALNAAKRPADLHAITKIIDDGGIT